MCKKVVLPVSVINSIREELEKANWKKGIVLVQVKLSGPSVADLFAFFPKEWH